MRIIIACAGGCPKWQGYLGVPSHFAPVRGVPVLHRTLEQALRVTSDVHITGPVNDPRYRLPGAVFHPREPESARSEYESTRELWHPDGRTVLLLGDVWFTHACFDLITGWPDEAFRVFGRAWPSTFTGAPYGEIWGASWWPQDHEALDQALAVVHATRESGECTRPPGWMLLIEMQGHRGSGSPLRRWSHRVNPPEKPWFVDTAELLPGDLTEDFDKPEDYAERHPLTRCEPAWRPGDPPRWQPQAAPAAAAAGVAP